MKCTKCGAELAQNETVCSSCGTDNRPAAAPKKNNKLILGAGVAAVIVIAAAIIFIISGSRKINLNKYASISVSGYDTIADAEFVFDYDKFEEDYGDKIKLKKSDDEEAFVSQLFGESAAVLLFELCVDGSFDKSSQLSNGDKVTYTWKCDDENVKELFGYKLKYSDIETTVSGLEAVPTFDPFEGIEVTFSGIAPNGTAGIKNNSTSGAASQVYFQLDKALGLSNGDVVTVSVSDNGSQNPGKYFVDKYGAVPTATEKEFKVEGLGQYVSASSEIPDDMLEKMKSQAEDVIKSNVARSWSEESNLDACEYVGNYFLTSKDTINYGSANMIYMVYKMQATIASEQRKINDTFEYYTYVCFTDMILMPDGTCSLDLSSYRTPMNSFTKTYPGGWFGYTYYVTGFEKLDSMFNKTVTTDINNYTYENNVTE